MLGMHEEQGESQVFRFSLHINIKKISVNKSNAKIAKKIIRENYD
ncbi:hypothetical protein BbINS_00640 [Bartonella bacilliformis INS]|uniref:Uncharacterized protein n=2 Tax=Bartonella bacilliformis TaxID=774 RepID=A1UR67_BARBK|nr:hypothetical protein BARBAKC583_0132 [Bartonella bacilliformis KC583]EKS46024.1 hypothetical protein BbINS_00640 [Bartonella bacilliformis INS]